MSQWHQVLTSTEQMTLNGYTCKNVAHVGIFQAAKGIFMKWYVDTTEGIGNSHSPVGSLYIIMLPTYILGYVNFFLLLPFLSDERP